MKYEVRFTNQFKKDVKLAKKQGKDIDKLFDVIGMLANGNQLDEKYRDHDLSGNYKGCRECHIEPDYDVAKLDEEIRQALKAGEYQIFRQNDNSQPRP